MGRYGARGGAYGDRREMTQCVLAARIAPGRRVGWRGGSAMTLVGERWMWGAWRWWEREQSNDTSWIGVQCRSACGGAVRPINRYSSVVERTALNRVVEGSIPSAGVK